MIVGFTRRPKSFLDAGTQRRYPTFVWFVPLTPNSVTFSICSTTSELGRLFPVDCVDIRWIPGSFSCGASGRRVLCQRVECCAKTDTLWVIAIITWILESWLFNETYTFFVMVGIRVGGYAIDVREKRISWKPTVFFVIAGTGWWRPIGYLRLKVIFRKRDTNSRALLQKMTYKDKASYGSSPPCITCVSWVEGFLKNW